MQKHKHWCVKKLDWEFFFLIGISALIRFFCESCWTYKSRSISNLFFLCLLWGPAAVKNLQLSSVKTLECLRTWGVETSEPQHSLNDISLSVLQRNNHENISTLYSAVPLWQMHLYFVHTVGEERMCKSFHNICMLTCSGNYTILILNRYKILGNFNKIHTVNSIRVTDFQISIPMKIWFSAYFKVQMFLIFFYIFSE